MLLEKDYSENKLKWESQLKENEKRQPEQLSSLDF